MNQNTTKTKTLFLTRHLPYPPMGGAALRNWQNINIMFNYGDVAVVSLESKKSNDKASYPRGISLWQNYELEKIQDRRSILSKIAQKLWFLQPQGHPWSTQVFSPQVVKQLIKLLADFQPQIIIFEELWLYFYLKHIQKYQGYLIYDAHNVEFPLRQKIYSSSQGIKAKLYSCLLLKKIKAIESSFVDRVDEVWVCSDRDARAIEQLYKQRSPLQVIPNGIEIDNYKSIRLGTYSIPKNLQSTPHTIVFTATFAYSPNVLAASVLIEQIYPKLKAIYSDCRLLLVGRDPSIKMIEEAKKNPDIIVTGRVPEIYPYLAAASVVVTPLFDGGGTRLKILEAFAAGLPVVSTTKGIEGLKVNDGEHLLIRDGIDDIVDGISQLWSKPDLKNKLVDAAYELVKAEYSWQAVGNRVDKVVARLGGVVT